MTRAGRLNRRGRADLVGDLLASAHILRSALGRVMEDRLLREATGGSLSAAQLRLLKLVALTEKHFLSDIAVFLGITKAGASRAVDRLVRRSLLRRSEVLGNRRAMELSLTEPARQLMAAYEAASHRKLRQIARRFQPEELIQGAQVLERVAAVLVDGAARTDQFCVDCGMYFRPRCLLRALAPRICFYESRGLRKLNPPAASP